MATISILGAGLFISAAGCETQQVARVGNEPREQIAYAATAKYPADQTARTGLQVAAVDNVDDKKLTLMNLSDNAIPPSTVWINGAYLHQVPTIAPRGMVDISYSQLLMAGPTPQDMKQSGQSVRKVELQTHDGFYTVQGPSKKVD
jgi:hypothetical protein